MKRTDLIDYLRRLADTEDFGPVASALEEAADALEAITSDEAVERGARVLVWEVTQGGYTHPDDRDRAIVRKVLDAAAGGDHE